MTKIVFSENNSGGSWWLSPSDYIALENAGWEVSYREATREGLSYEDAVDEWADITGSNPDTEGCPCCGKPFYFYEED